MMQMSSGGYHPYLMLNIDPDSVSALMQTDGRQVVSYCTWDAGFFDHISGEAEVLLSVGGSDFEQRGVLDYLDFVEGAGSTVEFSFYGDEEGENAPLATRWGAEGALNVMLRLNTSDEDLRQVPWDHPPRWTPGNEYASRQCLTDNGTLPEDESEWITPPTKVKTTVQSVQQQVIQPSDFAEGVDYRPLVVEDGEFMVDVEGSQDDEIWGTVNTEAVEGPDVDRRFHEDLFDSVVGSMNGVIRLSTAPSGDGAAPPLTIVQDNLANREIRHVLGPLGDA